jgi:APA family basic amino acid/polyamine antiporter
VSGDGGAVTKPASFVRGLSLFGAIALVAGNMLGTSLYTLPASLAAAAGPIGLLSWVITAAGFGVLATLYSALGTRFPRAGGPYVFTREAFGDFAGFQVVWMYWLSAVIGNAAIVTGALGYAQTFSPELAASKSLQFVLAQGILWALCFLNVRGIKIGARIQMSILVINLVPLTMLGYALTHFNPANLHPFAPHGIGSLATGSALLVWAYSGIESATVPAEEMQAPDSTIRRGTMLGFGFATIIFLVLATAVVGVLPNELIAGSPRPIELAVQQVLGMKAGWLVSVAAVAASIGVLNGWTLMVGRIPYSAAQDGIFFRRLAILHPRFGTPHVALIAGTAIASALLTLYFSNASTLLDVFTFLVLLANLGTLMPYLYNAAAALLLARRDPDAWPHDVRRRMRASALLCFIFLLWTTYGIGEKAVFWGFLVLTAGVPLYIWFRTSGATPNTD